MGVTINVDLGGVTRKLSKANLQRGQYAMANQMLEDMTPFVPYKEHHLEISGHVASNGNELIWDTPYAKVQFYGRSKHASWTAGKQPGTGPRWDLKAKPIYMNDWKKAFKDGAGL